MSQEAVSLAPNKTNNILDDVRSPNLIRVQITLQSIKDGLLMNPRTRELLEELAKLRSKHATDEGVPLEDRAAKKIIRNQKGEIGLPLKNLTTCLADAGREVKNGTRKISTADKTSIFQFLDFQDSFFPFTDQNAEWIADLQGGNGGVRGKQIAVAIIRPLFPKWSIVVTVDIDTKECSLSTVKQLFAVAGRVIGIGDYRARSNYGRFKIVEWKEIDI